jgi:carboxylate-amine ligase
MPDPEAAIRAFNGLRTHLPMLEALGANSPFRHGRDTGFASSRAMTIRAWPRSGVPRAMRDFADFKDYADRLTRVAGVPDYTFHWWKLRPHPRLGTVEIRALDAQASARETAGLAALVQCLARHEANGDSPEGPPPEVLEEVSYQAAREGVGGSVSGIGAVARHDTSELAAETIAVARTVAAELDCEAELSLLDSVIEQGGGAGRQRAAHAESGIDGVLRRLMDVADAPVQLDP